MKKNQKILSLTALIFHSMVLGCAQPKYQNVIIDPNQGSGSLQNGQFECVFKFVQNNICLSWDFENQNVVAQKNNSIILKLYRLNQFDQSMVYVNPDLGTQVKLTLWMPSMGHGSVPTQVTQLDVGTFRVTQVNFIMSGSWEIYFDLINNQVIDRLTTSIQIQ